MNERNTGHRRKRRREVGHFGRWREDVRSGYARPSFYRAGTFAAGMRQYSEEGPAERIESNEAALAIALIERSGISASVDAGSQRNKHAFAIELAILPMTASTWP